MRIRIIVLSALLAVASEPPVPGSAQSPGASGAFGAQDSVRGAGGSGLAVYELRTRPEIDGDLSEWRAVPPHAFAGPDGEPLARVRLGFGDEALYVALEVEDDTLAAPERAWRYGDGFYLTVLAPGPSDSSRSHVSLGFSRSATGPPTRVVVNRSGEYFPSLSPAGVELAVVPGAGELPLESPAALDGVVRYEVAVPWSMLEPAHPLAADSLRVNVVVVDRDGGTDRSVAKLYPDGGYDTERTPYRKAARLPLVRRPGGAAQLGLRLERPVLELGEVVAVHLASRGVPAGTRPARVRLVQGGKTLASWSGPLPETGGVPRRTVTLAPVGSGRTGPARVVAEAGPSGSPRVATARAVFLVNGSELDELDVELARIEDFGGPVGAAAPSAAIRLEWLRELVRSAPANAPVDRPAEWWAEIRDGVASLRVGKIGALGEPGVHRLAHRSATDGTLQPYSVFLPAGFDPAQPGGYPTVVALHGSGVDESGTIRTAAAMAAERGWIVVAPRGRGLSDWYVGLAGTDVMEALDHARRLYPIDDDRTYLAGFSMGGYGAWRLALLHGERFRGVAVMAGARCPGVRAECVEELMTPRGPGQRTPPPFLVLHGARDSAVPVDEARALVARLEALGWKHDYREFAAAGHGHPSWWSVAADWLASLGP